MPTNLFFLSFPCCRVNCNHSLQSIWLLLLSMNPYCWPVLSTFLRPLPFLGLSSCNHPILAVVFLVFCNPLACLSQIFSVISHLSFWPCLEPISSGFLLFCQLRKPQLQFLLLDILFSFSPISLHRLFSLSSCSRIPVICIVPVLRW